MYGPKIPNPFISISEARLFMDHNPMQLDSAVNRRDVAILKEEDWQIIELK